MTLVGPPGEAKMSPTDTPTLHLITESTQHQHHPQQEEGSGYPLGGNSSHTWTDELEEDTSLLCVVALDESDSDAGEDQDELVAFDASHPLYPANCELLGGVAMSAVPEFFRRCVRPDLARLMAIDTESFIDSVQDDLPFEVDCRLVERTAREWAEGSIEGVGGVACLRQVDLLIQQICCDVGQAWLSNDAFEWLMAWVPERDNECYVPLLQNFAAARLRAVRAMDDGHWRAVMEAADSDGDE